VRSLRAIVSVKQFVFELSYDFDPGEVKEFLYSARVPGEESVSLL
jgi:hypothetical protein